jgi:hypothetical protein
MAAYCSKYIEGPARRSMDGESNGIEGFSVSPYCCIALQPPSAYVNRQWVFLAKAVTKHLETKDRKLLTLFFFVKMQ